MDMQFAHFSRIFCPKDVSIICAGLNIRAKGQHLRMEWSAAGFVLQQNTDLANPSGWTDVPGGDVDFHTRARPELLPAKKTMRV